MVNSNNFQRPGPMWKRVVWNILAILALVIAIIIVLIVIGNFIDPASNLFAFVSAGLGTTYGPHMVLLSVIALIIGAIGFRIGPRRLGKVLMLVALVALVGSTIITKQIVGAIDAAGGSVNPVSALWLSSMSGSS
ncbi:MAG TPA: hypothetical protein VL485_29940, partial [Ktedonobacteraceae bacterium]|nr:hypothetical protein [Ktedonobacteraceae bacterium]